MTELYHVTPVIRLQSILNDGFLRPECALGKEKVVWLVGVSRLAWAKTHTKRRHRVTEVYVIRVACPQFIKLTRKARGVYCTPQAVRLGVVI